MKPGMTHSEDTPVPSLRERWFAAAFREEGDAVRAYRRLSPGASLWEANRESARLLERPAVKAAIRCQTDPDTSAARFQTAYIYTCCPYCHGANHSYQRTVAEMDRDRHDHERREDERESKAWGAQKTYERHEFDEKGGAGFNEWADAHPQCPNCHGVGIGRAVIVDSVSGSMEAQIANPQQVGHCPRARRP